MRVAARRELVPGAAGCAGFTGCAFGQPRASAIPMVLNEQNVGVKNSTARAVCPAAGGAFRGGEEGLKDSLGLHQASCLGS